MNRENAEEQLALLPDSLADRLRKLAPSTTADRDTRPAVAAFDLDNTLLIGDVGEAVFARLKKDEQQAPLTLDGTPLPLTWREYTAAVSGGDKIRAYREMVICMAGVPVATVRRATRRVMRSRRSHILLAGAKIPVPRVHPLMTALIGILRAWNFTVYVISASNFITVRTVAEEWLDIPAARAFGIACSTIRQPHPETGRPIDVLSGDLIEPVPVATGKADLYSQRIGDIAPRLTAGDSLLDIPMLALTESRGIILWAGDSEPVLQRLLPHPEILFRIEKPRPRG